MQIKFKTVLSCCAKHRCPYIYRQVALVWFYMWVSSWNLGTKFLKRENVIPYLNRKKKRDGSPYTFSGMTHPKPLLHLLLLLSRHFSQSHLSLSLSLSLSYDTPSPLSTSSCISSPSLFQFIFLSITTTHKLPVVSLAHCTSLSLAPQCSAIAGSNCWLASFISPLSLPHSSYSGSRAQLKSSKINPQPWWVLTYYMYTPIFLIVLLWFL